MSSSTVTYTSVYIDSEPGVSSGFIRGAKAPTKIPFPDYVPGPEEPEQAPLSPDYVLELEYPEFSVPSDAMAPMEDQPLPDDASPAALSLGYIADSDPEEDLEEDPEEDPADYPTDEGNDADDESSDDDDDEEYEDSEDDNKEEEEHLAPADSTALYVVDPVSLAKDTEAFETDESAPTPIPSSRRHTARMFVRPQIPMSNTAEALHRRSKLQGFPSTLSSVLLG
ncbi:hypothetical protein Tco_1533227 [Tanacetum coccineum]